MSANVTASPRLVRSYTAARRYPWVLGKLGDWVVWFGPYTPAQLVVLGGGALLLIKTFAWWSWLGPVPVVMWLVSVWAVRGAKVAGRSPSLRRSAWCRPWVSIRLDGSEGGPPATGALSSSWVRL